jgi:dephospho-CoA kinase
MLRVGLTGGLATGKTFVGRTLEDLGCLVIRADDLGHRVIEPGNEAYQPIVNEFGADILDATGKIDRRRLAAKVFRAPALLEKLNAMVHPPVRERTEREIADFAASHPDGIAVVEAAILVETGRHRDFDCLIVAVCGVEQQVERAMARDGLTREEVLDRLSRQMPLDQKTKYADYVIDTSGQKEETVRQVRTVHGQLLRRAAA